MEDKYVPSDDIVTMFSFLAGKEIEYNFVKIHRFCHEVNENFPDIFDYNYDTCQSYPHSRIMSFALDRMKNYHFIWGIDMDKTRIKDDCENVSERELFSRNKLEQLEHIACLFYEEFAA